MISTRSHRVTTLVWPRLRRVVLPGLGAVALVLVALTSSIPFPR